MALRFYDSFSHYTQAFLAAKWDIASGLNPNGNIANHLSQSNTGGRTNSGRLIFVGDQTNNFVASPYVQRNHSGASTIIAAMGLKQTATQILGRNSDGARWLSFLDGSTLQVAIQILQSGQLRAYRNTSAGEGWQGTSSGSGGFTTLGTSTAAISSSSFDFLEVKIVHHPSAGSITVKQNGVVFWSLTGQNTAPSGVNNSSSVIVGGFVVGVGGGATVWCCPNIDVSDFQLIDNVAGSDARDPVDFFGDLIGERTTPTADGAYAEWTPNSGAVHFDRIAEIPPDGDTTYNATATLNNRDSFIVSDSTAPTTAAVKCIVLTMYCRKDNGGSHRVSGLMRLAGADGLGTDFDVPGTYAFRQSFIFSTPAGAAITVANVNSSELGYKKTT